MPRRFVLPLVLICGLALFVWGLGSTGLVDETPPLFAASARAMARTGDWLIPRVNGLPRYDKPPLVYWLMGLIYALPAHAQWDPLGTWAARLPSALASVGLMLVMAAALLRWPQPLPSGRLPASSQQSITAVSAALAFALSPLVLLWSRIAVSDALLTGLLGAVLLLLWRCYAGGGRPWWAWILLGLAVLAKGPVAVVLAGMTLVGFGLWQRDLMGLVARLRPWPGLGMTALVALPWYGLAALVEGQPFIQSFFGYHNLQRFTGVVNNHLQPWWFFLPVLVVASLPFTPLLLAGLVSAARRCRASQLPEHSLQRFATCWLVAVLLFFTLAATKLPSYWIPATPAAGLLIALAAQQRPGRWLMASTLLLQGVLAAGLAASGRWVPLINEPELPTLPAELLASGLLSRASACFALALLAGLILCWAKAPWRWGWLLAQQLAVAAFAVSALQPLVVFGDRLRQAPLRRLAAAVQHQRRSDEPLAMVGILKPSLHFYTNKVVIYEGVQPNGPLNLNDRLLQERRREQTPSPPAPGRSVLLVIDQRTAQLPHWRGLSHQALASEGLFELWRVPRQALDQWAAQLKRAGTPPADWQQPRPERY
ncbi:glycosyltransferase family 39 protein [Synechococcus sp. CB0101]|uniref:ArnT family glycosyltransferase n=1 Tax=Synechococcus sp. CB0101 TaxID=232348 RepID=UPI0002001F96|nr:glycosyltransferase family 39 protein [Synechococcus sp. CB0101]